MSDPTNDTEKRVTSNINLYKSSQINVLPLQNVRILKTYNDLSKFNSLNNIKEYHRITIYYIVII